MSENDFLAGPGQMFVTSSYVPFRFVETNRTYKALQLIYPRNAFAETSRDELLLDPSILNADPLCCILRALCLAIGRGIQSRPESELKTLLDVARDLLPLIAGHKRIDAIDTMRHTPFDIIALEIDMSLPDSGFTLDHLSRRLGVSSRYIQRLFARRGTTFRDLLRQKRMERAQRQLAENKRSIQQIAADCGYSELSAFYRAFKRRFGCNPGEMRQMALGHITQNLQM